MVSDVVETAAAVIRDNGGDLADQGFREGVVALAAALCSGYPQTQIMAYAVEGVYK